MKQHAIVIADRGGVIQLWSGGAEQLFGYPATDIVGKRIDTIVPDQFHEAHWTGFGRAMERGHIDGAGTFFDIPGKCRDGTVRMMRGQLHILRDESSAAIGAMAIFTAGAE